MIDQATLGLLRFFWQQPLWGLRREGRLSVLLTGAGQRAVTALCELVVQAQLPDTAVRITWCAPDPQAAAALLQANRPGLGDGIALSIEGQTEIPCSAPLAAVDLTAQSPERLCGGVGLVLLCEEDNAQNARLAAALPAAAGWGVPGCDFEDDPSDFRALVHPFLCNLQTIYEKSGNPNASPAQVRRALNDPYSYRSNLRSIVHYRQKLAAMGIDMTDPVRAAAEIQARLNEDTVEQLSVLEHRRWMAEKLLCDGMRQAQPEGFERLFYSAPGIKTHGKGWHCCLVPCRPGSRITAADWAAPRPELDELDKTSIAVRNALGRLHTARRPVIDSLLSGLLCAAGETRSLLEDLKALLPEIDQCRRPAVSRAKRLLAQLKALYGQESRGIELSILESLSALLGAGLEWASFNDYKGYDRAFTRYLPFILTHRGDLRLVKVVSPAGEGTPSTLEDLYGIHRLEPAAVLLAVPEKSPRMEEKLRRIEDFFARRMNYVERRTLFLTPDTDLSAALGQFGAHCADVTGAEGVSLPLPRFRSTVEGRLENIEGMPWVEYPAADRPLEVQDSLELCGQVGANVSTRHILGLSARDIRLLWALRCRHREGWDTICNTPNPDRAAKTCPLSGCAHTPAAARASRTFPYGHLHLLKPLLWGLYQADVIAQPEFSGAMGEQVAVEMLPRNGRLTCEAGALLDALFALCETSCDTLDMNLKGGLTLSALRLEGKAPRTQPVNALLAALSEAGFLTDRWEQDGEYRFRCRNAALMHLFDRTGSAFENLLYHVVLEAGCFYSVENSILFYRESGATRNEIDLAATCGTKTFFISCKDYPHMTEKQLSAAAAEIARLAGEYGINGVPVLAVSGAESRLVGGVPLLGRDLLDAPGQAAAFLGALARGEGYRPAAPAPEVGAALTVLLPGYEKSAIKRRKTGLCDLPLDHQGLRLRLNLGGDVNAARAWFSAHAGQAVPVRLTEQSPDFWRAETTE